MEDCSHWVFFSDDYTFALIFSGFFHYLRIVFVVSTKYSEECKAGLLKNCCGFIYFLYAGHGQLV